MAERYDAGLLGDGGGGDVQQWHDYLRCELDRAHEFYTAEIERLRALVNMMADAFDNWEEPKHDGTREWCSRFNTYLRGHVVAQATFTEEDWAKVKTIREDA